MLTIAPFPAYSGGGEGQRVVMASLCHLEKFCILISASWDQSKDHPLKISEEDNIRGVRSTKTSLPEPTC